MATITNTIRWADNTADLKKNLLEGIGTIDAMKASVDRTVQSLSGNGLFQAANKVTAAIIEMGGATKLTASEQDRANGLIDKAIEKYKLMGMTAPPAMIALRDAMKGAGDSAGGLLEYIGSLGDSFVARVAEGVLLRDVIRDIIDVGKSALENASAFKDLSLATGLSTDAIQKFSYVGAEFGIDTGTMARGVEQLSAKLANGDKNAASAVASLGLNVKSLMAEGPEDAFLDVAAAVGRIEDPMTKGGIAAELFGGKLAKILLPAMSDLKQKLDEVPKDAIISQEDIDNAHSLEVGFGHLITKVEAYAVALASLPGKVGFGGEAADVQASIMVGLPVGTTTSLPGGKDVDLSASSKMLDNATLLKQKLDSLRKDSLEPLTAAQKDNITQLKEWGEGESQIAKDVDASDIAVHLYIETQKANAEAAKKAADAAKQFQRVIEDVNSAGSSWQDTLQKMNPAIVEQSLNLLNAGISAKTVGEYYGLTESQTKALSDQHVFLAATSAATAKEFGNLGGVIIPDLSEHAQHLQEVLADLSSTDNEFHDGITVAGDTIATVTIPLFTTLPNVVAKNTKEIDSATKSTTNWVEGLGSLSRALSEVGRSANGMTATVANDLAGMTKSIESTQKGFQEFSKDDATTMDKIVGGATAAAGIISLVGQVISAVAHIGGPSQEELAGRQTEAQFEQQMGGWQGIQKALLGVGVSADDANAMIQNLWASEKQGSAATQAAIDAINNKIKTQTDLVSGGVQSILDAAQTVGGQAPAALQPLITKLEGMPGITDAEKKSLDALLGNGPDLQTITDTASKYGITLDALGSKTQQLSISSQADQMEKDYQTLINSGADVGAVQAGMSKSFGDLVENAIKYGSTLPTALQPILDSMAKAGTLTDSTGKKISDISGIKFDDSNDPLAKGLSTLTDSINNLIKVLSHDVPDAAQTAADGITKHLGDIPPIDVNVRFRTGDGENPSNYAASGGMVTNHGIQYFAGGGSVLSFTPRGSDTVPAMLTPGEMVLNRRQQQAVFGGSGGGSITELHIHVDVDGKQIGEAVTKYQTRDLHTRRRLRAA